jgi:hypothetical protein
MKGKKRVKKEKWETLYKFKTEVFDVIKHQPYNSLERNIHTPPEELDPFFPTPLNTRTATPYVEIHKDPTSDFESKHVEIGYFTPITRDKEEANLLDEETWIKESVDIFNSTSVNRTTIVLEKNEEKVKLSIFKFSKSRQVGHRYFAKHSKDIHLTFNLKTKNFFITQSKFGNRKRITNTTKNDFLKILKVLNPIHVTTLLNKIVWYTGGLAFHDYKEEKKLEVFMEEVRVKLQELLGVHLTFTDGFGTGLGYGVMEWFIKQWEIKVPNNYYQYLFTHYPGIRKLRKQKMNLIRAILQEKKLGGKYYIRLLNRFPSLNLTDLVEITHIFGPHHCKLVPFSFLTITNSHVDNKWSTLDDPVYQDLHPLTKYEKLNLLKVLSQVEDPHFLTQLYDHFRIKEKLLKFGIKKRIKAKTLEQFQSEHTAWSNLVHQCERNKETHYEYPPLFVKHLEQDIMVKRKGEPTLCYKVKVLKTDLEYFEEGQHQHHCVRTYVDRYRSLIISLRKGNERMTCEFVPERIYDQIPKASSPYYLVQTQLKFNSRPTGDWEEVIKYVEKRIELYFSHHSFKLPIIHLYNKISGKKDRLVWDKEDNQFKTTDGKIQNYVTEDLPF